MARTTQDGGQNGTGAGEGVVDPLLVAVMARLAAGDGAALHELLEGWGTAIRCAMRRQLDHLKVPVNADLLDDLAIDACLALQSVAASWRSDGGALPWVWAERRLLRVAVEAVGQHAVPLDASHDRPAEELPMPAHGGEDEVAVLASIARRLPPAELLLRAFDEVTTSRDQRVLLAYETLRAEGHPAAAESVAARYGLGADNVRQIASRARRRLRQLAASDGRFAGLAELALLA